MHLAAIASEVRLSVGVLTLACSCMPADFDDVERMRASDPITDCDAGDAATCGHDAGASPDDAGTPMDAAFDAAGPHDAAAPDSGCSACKAGETMSETGKCGACSTGTRTRSRRCQSDGCGFEPYGEWSACTGVTAACAPNDTTACENGDECGHRVCTAACTWGPCEPREANGCLRIGPGHTEPGTNYECCGKGHWHFCVPGCRWSEMCVPCMREFCEC